MPASYIYDYEKIMKTIDAKGLKATSVKIGRKVKAIRTKIEKPRGKPIVWGDRITIQNWNREVAYVDKSGMLTLCGDNWVQPSVLSDLWSLEKFSHKNVMHIVPIEFGRYTPRTTRDRHQWPIWKPNMRFNLHTREFENAEYLPQFEKTADDTVWKGKLIKFHRIMNAYVKLEGLEHVLDEMRDTLKPLTKMTWQEREKHMLQGEARDQALIDAVNAMDPVMMTRSLCMTHAVYSKLFLFNQRVTGETIHEAYRTLYNGRRTEIRAAVGALKARTNDGEDTAVSVEAECSHAGSPA